jgi:hypothetical protein
MAFNLSIVLVGALAGDATGLETIAANLRIFPAVFIVLPIRAGAISHLKDSQRQGTTAGYACV